MPALHDTASAPTLAEPAVRVEVGLWLLLSALLIVPSLWVGAPQHLPTHALAWHADTAFTQPWRWWSAAWVHLSREHLLINVGAALVVAALGAAVPVRPRAAMAWALAWPLTHLALALQPGIGSYGGLSGVLHAGVAIGVVELARGDPRQRLLALTLGVGLIVKLGLEAAWQTPVHHDAAWTIPLAPFGHLSGAVAGAVLALVLRLRRRGGVRG